MQQNSTNPNTEEERSCSAEQIEVENPALQIIPSTPDQHKKAKGVEVILAGSAGPAASVFEIWITLFENWINSSNGRKAENNNLQRS